MSGLRFWNSLIISDHLYANIRGLMKGTANLRFRSSAKYKTAAKPNNLISANIYYFQKAKKNQTAERMTHYSPIRLGAYIGALYMDKGIEAVKDFLSTNLNSRIKRICRKKKVLKTKSLLQEKTFGPKKLAVAQ